MNDRRFIELLNLYVDQQIHPDEASELEAEVLRNPERRRTYDQYCRLQRGCCLLGDGARSIAPSSHGFARSLRDAERKIAAPRRAAWRPAYAGVFSVATMAACVAVVVVVNRPAPSPDTTGGMVASTPEAQPLAPTTEAVAAMALTPTEPALAPSFDLQPVLAATGLGVARNAREAEIAAHDREALEWMQRIDLLPVSRVVVDEQAFESRPTLQQDNRVFRSRHSLQGNAEFTAFQFQR
ncbi:MAG: hypothetical protein K0R17_660 [Rariglobus sp.]|jgi:hypothetical protein|nr:hypothetical protein [Rariglobus sp.]